MKHILLLEDDDSLGTVLRDRLSSEGFRIHWCTLCESARRAVAGEAFDLAIVDVGLPDGDGFTFVRELRERHRFPVMFLTAMNSAEYRLEGFEIGGDDYVPKPFHLRELLLRIHKLVDAPIQQPLSTRSGFVFSDASFQLTIPGQDQGVQLPPREYELLKYLARASPRVVNREEILSAVFRSEPHTSPRTVDNSVSRIRALLGAVAEGHLRSVRGVGYQWVE